MHSSYVSDDVTLLIRSIITVWTLMALNIQMLHGMPNDSTPESGPVPTLDTGPEYTCCRIIRSYHSFNPFLLQMEHEVFGKNISGAEQITAVLEGAEKSSIHVDGVQFNVPLVDSRLSNIDRPSLKFSTWHVAKVAQECRMRC